MSLLFEIIICLHLLHGGDLDDSDDDGSNDDSIILVLLLFQMVLLILFVNLFQKTQILMMKVMNQITIQIFRKHTTIFEVSHTLKKWNVKLTKKIKKLTKD